MPEDLILGIDTSAGPLPPDALSGIKQTTGLAEALLQQPATFTSDGADERAMRLARLLTSPALAAANEAGGLPLPDAAAEAGALRALSAVAEARLAALPSPASQKDGTPEGDMLAEFVAEKQRVLRASAAALEMQAQRSK